MDKINNISAITDCYGCGVCATACPKNIINIRHNSDGFYQPYIDELDKCIQCGLCLKVCSYTKDSISSPNTVKQSYASWSKDKIIRSKSSSGGTGFEIGRNLIQQGFEAIGVRYNAKLNRAEHYIASSIEELQPAMGSKYIQSYTVDAFKKIDKNKKYLVTGTPCQIDSFRRYIKLMKIEDRFILMDFFCHGVPSKLIWDKYLDYIKKQTGNVIHASWRNKETSWHNSYSISVEGEKSNFSSQYSKGDVFYRLFLSDNCLGKACYDKCKYKYNSSSADIRIGDLWGKKYLENEEGITGVIIFTEKGEQVIKDCNCHLKPEPFMTVADGQMTTPAKRGKLYERIWKLLHNDKSTIQEIAKIINRDINRKRTINRLRHPYRTFINLVKRIVK